MGNPISSRLGEWLDAHGIAPAEFARRVGANRSQVYRLLSDERGPSAALAGRIEEVTAGEIRAAEWPLRRRQHKRRSQGSQQRGSKARHASTLRPRRGPATN